MSYQPARPRAIRGVKGKWLPVIEFRCGCGYISVRRVCPKCGHLQPLRAGTLFQPGDEVMTVHGPGRIRTVWPRTRYGLPSVYSVLIPYRTKRVSVAGLGMRYRVVVLYGYELERLH